MILQGACRNGSDSGEQCLWPTEKKKMSARTWDLEIEFGPLDCRKKW
jgi:hypothetical protein